MTKITATHNPLLKKAIALKQRKFRSEYGAFIAEGTRNVEMALASEMTIEYCLYTEEFPQNERNTRLIKKLLEKCPCHEISQALFAKVSDTKTPQGILIVLKKNDLSLKNLTLPKNIPLTIAVFDGLQDPGNAGTILRTADSMGAFAVIALKGTVDMFSPKVVRATMGSIFYLPVIERVEPEELSAFCAQNELVLLAAMVDKKAKPIVNIDFKRRCAIVLGNEGNGISPQVQSLAKEKFFIPMHGRAESLNAASAAAMTFYEAARQNFA